MTARAVVFRRSRVQDGQKSKRSVAPETAGVPKALIKWRGIEPVTTREELAVICLRSVSTVDRWARGVGEPTVTDVWLMERHKPGLVDMLFSSAKREVGRRALRA
jgi:hypothetical protein